MNLTVPTCHLRQCVSVDQSDRHVPINLRQSGPTPVDLLISTRVRKSGVPFRPSVHPNARERARSRGRDSVD